jgi:hypothetical protein
VIADLEATGSLRPGLNWYRANIPPESWVGPPPQLPPVQAPTMGIWSTGDMALSEAQMTDSAEGVAGPWRSERLDGAGHWMQLGAARQAARSALPLVSAVVVSAGQHRQSTESILSSVTVTPGAMVPMPAWTRRGIGMAMATLLCVRCAAAAPA